MTPYATYPSLEARPVIISGGASGIGEAMVRAFAQQGAKVGFVDIAADAGEALATDLRQQGQTASFVRCDVTDTDAYRSAIAELAALHGEALILVNNAAHDQRHLWNEVTPDEWDQRIAVNLRHAFFAIQAVAPGMARAGRGSVINFGSISWMVMTPGLPVYETAKAALHGLTRSMARELGPSGIRVNTLVPGAVMTQRQLDLWISPEALADIKENQAIPEAISPEDCARMALFLAADDSAMVTGQHFLVDAGWANT